jgi:cysteinyl-tRNA synthetase
LYNDNVKIKDENLSMKKKELKRLAQRIADLEQIIQKNEDAYAVKTAKNTIMDLSGRLDDPEDMFYLDEIIQQILDKDRQND